MANFSMIFRGALLGIGAAAPLGPVNVEIARRTLQRGFRAGFALGCGAVTIDVAYAIAVSMSLRPAMLHPTLMLVLGLLGAGLLTYLGVGCLLAASRVHPMETSAPIRSAGHYLTGLLMTSLNPMTLAFWFLAVPATVWKLTTDPIHDLPLLCAGVFASTLGWVCTFAGALSLARGGVKLQWMKFTNLAGGIFLLVFAGMTIWRAARAFLS